MARPAPAGGVPGLLQKLEGEAAERLKSAYAPKSKGSLHSALAALARFAASCPTRELFVRPRALGDMDASAHNEWTFILFVWYMSITPSPTTGKLVATATVQTYTSLLKGYLSFSYAFELIDKPLRLQRLFKSLAEDAPEVVRKKRRGLRRRHLRRVGRLPIAKKRDLNTVNRMAAVATAWHVLARGGEIAPDVPASQWCKDKMPTRADLSFHRRRGRRYARVWLRPLKKKGKAAAAKVPQYIAEHDGSGSDVYALLRRLETLDPVEESERATTPLFRTRVKGRKDTVRHMRVGELRAFVKVLAKELGFTNAAEWGAHSMRVGGATDLAATGQASELLLKAKGRWSSEIGAIYARMTPRALLAASRLMQKARGRDLEEVLPGFVQPA